jgi:hypothetical protein
VFFIHRLDEISMERKSETPEARRWFQTHVLNYILGNLHSLLDISASQNYPIQSPHPSFRDFLLDQNQCLNSFWINERKTHRQLAESCLRVMSRYLKKDICCLKTLDASSSPAPCDLALRALSAELQYTCRYWVQHLQKSVDILRISQLS